MIVLLFILCIICITTYIYFEDEFNNIIYVHSKIDSRNYLVRNVKDKQEAADRLAKLNNKLLMLIDKLKKNIDNYDNEYKDAINRLKFKYNPNTISESLQNSEFTSYSVNKGEKIVFCLRSKKTQKFEDFNILMFVALHELAHLMTKSIGHTPEFWKNFKFLLKKAIKINIYKKQNYTNNPKQYCGISILDSPLDNEDNEDNENNKDNSN